MNWGLSYCLTKGKICNTLGEICLGRCIIQALRYWRCVIYSNKPSQQDKHLVFIRTKADVSHLQRVLDFLNVGTSTQDIFSPFCCSIWNAHQTPNCLTMNEVPMGNDLGRLNLASHRNFPVAVDDPNLSNISHVLIHQKSVFLSRIERTRSSIGDLLGKCVTSLFVSPKIDHIDEVKWSVDNKISMSFNLSTPLLIVVNLMAVESQCRESEERDWSLDEVSGMLAFSKCDFCWLGRRDLGSQDFGAEDPIPVSKPLSVFCSQKGGLQHYAPFVDQSYAILILICLFHAHNYHFLTGFCPLPNRRYQLCCFSDFLSNHQPVRSTSNPFKLSSSPHTPRERAWWIEGCICAISSQLLFHLCWCKIC